MPYLLLGPDDYSKKIFVDNIAQKLGADLAVFTAEEVLPEPSQIYQNDLFSKPKVFYFKGFVPDFISELKETENNKNRVLVAVDALDKRKKENKELLSAKNIEVKEFTLPHGKGLDAWIIARVTALGGKISGAAAGELALRLGRDNAKETKVGGKLVSVEEVYSLWQAENELQKLLAYTQGKEITVNNVIDLAAENGDVDVFKITNAIAEGKKQLAFELLDKFLSQLSASDEKAAVIQLNALLSEQFRNVAMVQDFMAKQMPEDKVLEVTGWKSGRLFVMNKISTRFGLTKVLETLKKMEALDQEIKTSNTPPKVLLDLIISQLFS